MIELPLPSVATLPAAGAVDAVTSAGSAGRQPDAAPRLEGDGATVNGEGVAVGNGCRSDTEVPAPPAPTLLSLVAAVIAAGVLGCR